MFKKILQKEIQRLKKNGSLYEEDGLRIYVLDTENKLPVNETELEDFAYGAKVLKQDKGVLACKKQVGQRCFFFKKTFHKNKKFHHIFKYCFLPSRGFTNAAVSNQLIRNGIRTPKVFLCAERKKNIFSIPVILENSYMISEALDSKELSELIPQVLSDPRTVAQFLANWGGV